jgi:prepilin-type N-terminal cleavage/methylation domain-containing protein
MAMTQRGFTLAEAMIASAALGMISLVAGTLLLNTSRFNTQASARAAIQRDARICVEGISRELAQARGHTIVVDRYDAGQPPYSRLTFSQTDGRTVSYYQRGRGLYRKMIVGASVSTVLVADGLRQAAFSYPRSDNAGLVAISVAFERANASSTKALELSLSHVRVQNPDAF